MRFLIAQGPGYYGVNIRILSDEEGGALEGVMAKLDTAYEGVPPGSATHLHNNNGMSVFLTGKVDIHKSGGFDSGKWEEGETAINALISMVKQ